MGWEEKIEKKSPLKDLVQPGLTSLTTPSPQEAQKRVQSHTLFPHPSPFDKCISILFDFSSWQAKGGLSGSVGCIRFSVS